MDNKLNWESLHADRRFRSKYPHPMVVRYVLRNFKGDGKTKILDLGCGSGRHIIFMAGENLIPYGLDISQNGINYTRKAMEENGGDWKICLQPFSANSLPRKLF